MPATKRMFGGWRGFSLAKEGTYDTFEAITSSINWKGGPFNVMPNEELTDEEDNTGYNEPTEHNILNWKGEGVHSNRAMPHNVALFGALALGKVTTQTPDLTNNPDVRLHWLERELTQPQMVSISMTEFIEGRGKKRYPGLICDGLKISGERGRFVEMEATLKNSGKVQDGSADSRPALPGEQYLRYGDVELTRGGSISGSVAAGNLAVGGGPTSFKSTLRSFEYALNPNAEAIYENGDNSGYISRFEFGDRWTHDLTAILELQDDGHDTALQNGTEYVLNIPLVGGVIAGGDGSYNYTVNLIFPKVVYKEGSAVEDGKKILQNVNFQVLEDATYGSVIIQIINKVTGYLT